MSEQKESSVLFSLKELMNLEEDRIRGEEDAKAARVAADEEARRQAELAARNAEEARLHAEAERRRAEEQRSREEAARLEAIRVAEVEKARLQAEHDAQRQAMAAQQQHQIQLETIRKDEGKKKLRNMLIGIIAAVTIIGGVGIYLIVDYSKAQDKKQADAKAEIDKLNKEKDELTQKAKEAAEKVGNLESAVANEKDATKKAQLQAELNKAKADAAAAEQEAENKGVKAPAGGFRGGAKPGGDDKPEVKKPCTCAKTDPLCDCL